MRKTIDRRLVHGPPPIGSLLAASFVVPRRHRRRDDEGVTMTDTEDGKVNPRNVPKPRIAGNRTIIVTNLCDDGSELNMITCVFLFSLYVF